MNDAERTALAAAMIALADSSLSPYRVLGVTPREAREEPEVISARRRRLATQFHPDRWPDAQMMSHAAMARINVAFDLLNDPRELKRYTMTKLAKTHKPCPGCDGNGDVVQRRGFTRVSYGRCVQCEGEGYVRK